MKESEYEKQRRPVTPRIRDLWLTLERGLKTTRPRWDYDEPKILKTRKVGGITYKFVRQIEICGKYVRLFLDVYEYRRGENGNLLMKHEFRFTTRIMLDDFKEWVACEPGLLIHVKDGYGKTKFEPIGEGGKKSPEAWVNHLFEKMYGMSPDKVVETEAVELEGVR